MLDEVERVRIEAGSPPLAAPLGQIVASQALVNILGSNRYATIVDELRDLVLGRFGQTPGPIDPSLHRAVELLGAEPPQEPIDIDGLRLRAHGLAASEEELLLLALFGDEAEPLLRSIRQRTASDEPVAHEAAAQGRDELIRSVVQIVQDTGVGEITVEEQGVRVSVRRSVIDDTTAAEAAPVEPGEAEAPRAPDATVKIESPMVGTFYRGPKPGAPPFVEENEPISPGQVLCILEAMKLMNEVKAEQEAIVRKILVVDGQPVEYGQVLFELEPLNGRPDPESDVPPRPRRQPWRDRRPRDPRGPRARDRGRGCLLDRRRRLTPRPARR